MKSIIRKVIIFIIIIAVVLIGYSFVKDPEVKTSLSSTPAVGLDQGLNADTQAVLSLLQSITKINLNTGIFSRASYLSLEDQEKVIPPDLNPGRVNPFAPIGLDSSVVSQSSVDFQNFLNSTNSQNTNQSSSNNESQNSSASTIKTLNPTIISRNEVILRGEILTSNIGAKRYFEYGVSQNTFSVTTTKVSQEFPGTFSYSAKNLLPNTTYYYRAVILIEGTAVLGEVKSFSTLP